MAAYLRHVGTAVPSHRYDQAAIQGVMEAWVGGERRTDRLLRRVYPHSGIEQRHTVLGDFLSRAGATNEPTTHTTHVQPQGPDEGFFLDDLGAFRNPTTGERNARYRREAGPLYVAAARATLDGAAGLRPEDVTHVITVSCTGFYAPGPDLDVVHGLGLRPTTDRYHVGFMGCYAAFPALRMARAFCHADPNAVVLVVIVELCTLHLSASSDVDAVISASVFADGAAGAIVTAQAPEGPSLLLDRFVDGLAPEGAGDMAWTIGTHGFDMVLSSYVPKIVGEKASLALEPLLDGSGVRLADVTRWAIHPGGRAILDQLERGMSLPPAALEASRHVLAQYGNMSAATILFVLAEVMRSALEPGEPVVAMAFGPGLTVASGLFRAT